MNVKDVEMKVQDIEVKLVNPDNDSKQLSRPPLRRVQASQYLLEKYNISRTPATLAKMAVVGGGPAYRCATRFPMYAISDLDAWAESIMSPLKTSTSDAGQEH